MKTSDIAPCGINCAVCYVRQREKNRCPGCRTGGKGLPGHCGKCKIRNCEIILSPQEKECTDCPKFPCKPLKSVDRNYRSRYGISTLENLRTISQYDTEAFIETERLKWLCPCGGRVCANTGVCLICGKGKES